MPLSGFTWLLSNPLYISGLFTLFPYNLYKKYFLFLSTLCPHIVCSDEIKFLWLSLFSIWISIIYWFLLLCVFYYFPIGFLFTLKKTKKKRNSFSFSSCWCKRNLKYQFNYSLSCSLNCWFPQCENMKSENWKEINFFSIPRAREKLYYSDRVFYCQRWMDIVSIFFSCA